MCECVCVCVCVCLCVCVCVCLCVCGQRAFISSLGERDFFLFFVLFLQVPVYILTHVTEKKQKKKQHTVN